MTVGENIFLGKEPLEHGVIHWNRLYAESKRILDRFGIDISPHAVVKDLGVGKQQMAEIAKALSENASILILDEPTSALSKEEVERLMEILRGLKNHGVTCLYISHKLEEFFQIADRVTVMRDGKVVTTEEISRMTLERMVNYMVGREMNERFPKRNRHPGEVILRVEDLHAEDPFQFGKEILKGVSFDLRKGEILGIAGLMGSGRTELVTTLFGEFGKITRGKIHLEGREIAPRSAREAMELGISLVPEDRKMLGLVLIQSILENITLPNLNRFSSFLRINRNAALQESMQYARELSIKAPHLHIPVEALSGGNQQKVVISKWLMSKPKILILDDPTRGIDVGAKYEIYKLMNELAERGVSIIMISSELEEVLGMSDRVLVMCEGKSAGVLPIEEATQEKIMALATGVDKHLNHLNHRSRS
jgi:D-xylose transport system ATP-binding protein